jgi:hypothetical protein
LSMIASRFGFTNTKPVIRGHGVTARLAFDTHKIATTHRACKPAADR